LSFFSETRLTGAGFNIPYTMDNTNPLNPHTPLSPEYPTYFTTTGTGDSGAVPPYEYSRAEAEADFAAVGNVLLFLFVAAVLLTLGVSSVLNRG
jgi:hypothetical protein